MGCDPLGQVAGVEVAQVAPRPDVAHVTRTLLYADVTMPRTVNTQRPLPHRTFQMSYVPTIVPLHTRLRRVL